MSAFVTVVRPGKRILTIGSTMGAGHMSAANALARDAERAGAHPRVVDYLDLPAGAQGKCIRALYRTMVTKTPWLYDDIMRAWMRHPRMFERFSSIGQSGYIRGLQQQIDEFHPDVIVSTYNLAGQLLGRLRASGRLTTTAIAYVTDAGPHPYWVAPGVDLHLAPLRATAEGLRKLGASRVEVVAPLAVEPSPLSRAQARERLRVPADARVALVNGGSWGVGAIEDAAQCIAAAGVEVYVLCGHARRLSRRVSVLPHCHAVGWTSDVPIWIRAADVVVDSAAGTTGWEALVADRPLIVHKPLAGHGRLNAVVLQEVGLATVTYDHEQLSAAVWDTPLREHGDVLDDREAARVLLDAA